MARSVNLKARSSGSTPHWRAVAAAWPASVTRSPPTRARRVAADLVAFGRVRRAYLGVQIEPVPPSSPDRPADSGAVVITSVNPGSPAAEAGLRPGDGS